MLKKRLTIYKKLEEKQKSKLLVYITSDRRGLETRIAQDILSPLTNHLDSIGDVDKITLFLYTRGGDTIAAWTLVNLIRNFCKEFEIIIPFHCHSAGTLISLGANQIIMTKQATLGPIDPSVNGPLNPEIPGLGPGNQKVPVSVEFVNAYIEMAKRELNIRDEKELTKIFLSLSEKIHPLALGQVYRSNSQIKMLAKNLLESQKLTKDKKENIINFLCSESGSHDYTIHRDEAQRLGLKIEKPDDELYDLIKQIYQDIENELQLTKPYDPKVLIGTSDNYNYKWRRALLESIAWGCDVYISEGVLEKQVLPAPAPNPPRIIIQDNRKKEGWEHERPSRK